VIGSLGFPTSGLNMHHLLATYEVFTPLGKRRFFHAPKTRVSDFPVEFSVMFWRTKPLNKTKVFLCSFLLGWNRWDERRDLRCPTLVPKRCANMLADSIKHMRSNYPCFFSNSCYLLGWAVQFLVIDWGYSRISTNVVAIFGQKGQLKLGPKTHAWKTTGILPLKRHISPGTKNISPGKIKRNHPQKCRWETSSQNSQALPSNWICSTSEFGWWRFYTKGWRALAILNTSCRIENKKSENGSQLV